MRKNEKKIEECSDSKALMYVFIALALMLLALIIIFTAKSNNRRKGEVVATVNNFKIHRKDLDARLNTLSPGAPIKLEDLPDNIVKAMSMEAYINDKIDKQAKKFNYNNDVEVARITRDFRKNLIRERFLNDRVFSAITEEQLRGEYDRLVKNLEGKEERKISHILLENQADAERARKAIISGERFSKVAKERSLDKASAENGGSIGYVLKEELVPEFGDVAYILKVGEVSKPVQSQFGWHLIKVEDIRPATFSPYDEVKNNLDQKLRQEAVQKFLEKETTDADVKILIKRKEKHSEGKNFDTTIIKDEITEELQ